MSKTSSELLKQIYINYGTSQTSLESSSSSSSDNMKPLIQPLNTLDKILISCIGPFGRWQCRVSVLAALLKFPIAWFQLGIVFLAPSTSFWCRRPPPEIMGPISLEKWHDLIDINNTDTGEHPSFVHGNCYMHDPRTSYLSDPVPCVWGYEFNTTVVYSSIITEWQMVCGREKLIDVTQAVIMFGYLLGTLTLGLASDNFGRKPVLIWCLLIQSIAGIISAVAPSYILFIIVRFIVAFANAGTMICSFVICMEVVGGEWRTIVPILYQIPFGIGNTVMAIIAYFIRDWRQLQFILAALSSGYIIYWKFLPESPRWLLATGQIDKAAEILKKAAIENKKSVTDVAKALEQIPSLHLDAPIKPNLRTLIATPTLRSKTIFLCFHWTLAGISFYGFSQYMGQITKHLYAMMAIAGLVALPGTFLCCMVVKNFGRRETIAGAHVFTAICYMGLLICSCNFGEFSKMSLATFGIAGLSISTPALYLFTGETFPTVLRNVGMGVTMMCCRIGSILAPFINSLSRMSGWLPLTVLSVCVLIEALLLLPLPETKDQDLPDTISHAELLTKKRASASIQGQ